MMFWSWNDYKVELKIKNLIDTKNDEKQNVKIIKYAI